MQGLSEIANLDVTIDFDEQTDAITFTITADSYTYDGASVTSLSVILEFDDDGQLISSTGIDTLSGITKESLEQWFEYSDPEKNDEYARIAVEELFKQIGIENYHNLTASISPIETGVAIQIIVDSFSFGGQEMYAVDMTFNFIFDGDGKGTIDSKAGVPAGLESNAFSDNNLNTWFEYSGPDKQREIDQQQGGYFEGDDGHQQSYSNVWSWEDGEGVLWTVVDKDVNGVWSSTETGSNGDVRTHKSIWDHATQTSTYTETYVSTNRGIDSKTVEVSDQTGVTKTYTGTADGLGWMPLNELYTDLNVVETLDQYWNTISITGTAVRSEERRVGKECRSRWSP